MAQLCVCVVCANVFYKMLPNVDPPGTTQARRVISRRSLLPVAHLRHSVLVFAVTL